MHTALGGWARQGGKASLRSHPQAFLRTVVQAPVKGLPPLEVPTLSPPLQSCPSAPLHPTPHPRMSSTPSQQTHGQPWALRPRPPLPSRKGTIPGRPLQSGLPSGGRLPGPHKAARSLAGLLKRPEGRACARPPSLAVLSRPWGSLSPWDPPFSGDPRSCVLSTRLHPAKEQPWGEEGNFFVNFALCYGKLLGLKNCKGLNR